MYPRKLQLHRKGHSNRVSDFHDFVCSSLPKAMFLCPPSPTKGSEAGGRGGGGGHIVFGQRRRRRKISRPLCNLITLCNILMILGRNVDQDEMTCRIQD